MAKNNIINFQGARPSGKKQAGKQNVKTVMKPLDKNADPQMTIEVKNETVEGLLRDYAASHDGATLNKLVNELVKTRVLIPAQVNEKKVPLPMLIKNKDGNTLLPIYTSKEQIPKEPKAPAVMNMPFVTINKMALNEKLQLNGLVINPFTNNLVFKMELVKKIDEVEEMKKNGQEPPKAVKQIKMTEPQYNAFERNRYEFGFLPSKLFEDADLFLSTLLDRKEEYIDELYEECYQQKRMYPYLPEDFSIMALNISEELLAVRLDMPARDMAVPSCYRIYMIQDKSRDLVRYFTIEKLKEGTALGEVTADKKHLSHGEAPAEGAELQTILDMVSETEDAEQ